MMFPKDVKTIKSKHRHSVACGSLIFICAAFGSIAATRGESGSGTREQGVGRAAYMKNCASCHGVDLNGSFGPKLLGNAFKSKWQSHEEDLLKFIRSNMPPVNRGSLDDKTYRAVTNYIIGANFLSLIVDSGTGKVKNSAGGVDYGEPAQKIKLQNANAFRDSVSVSVSIRNHSLITAMTSVTQSMLANPPDKDWLLWRRTYSSLGYSPLSLINAENVKRLVSAWTLSLPVGTNESTPLVHDGIIFLNNVGVVYAIDAARGEILWSFSREEEPGPPVPLTQPRSMSIGGLALYVPTVDGHILALDATNGKLIWDHPIEQWSGENTKIQITGGPLVIRDKILVGVAGCSLVYHPGGCFIVALSRKDGREIWRFNTIARPGAPGGDSWGGAPVDKRFGASVWTPGSYDPQTDLAYFGTGQTYHISDLLNSGAGPSASNAALFTDTTLALDPDSGRLVWHYQHMARDVWDLDWSFERSIVSLPGQMGPSVITMGKAGILDALDARTGRYQFSFDMGFQNLVGCIDPKTGEKRLRAGMEPVAKRSQLVCPLPIGGRNFPASAYDPNTATLYVPTLEDICMDYMWTPGTGSDISAMTVRRPGSDGEYGRVAAINLESRRIVWSARHRSPPSSAILATGGGLVFEGTRDRWFRARDSGTGEVLWQVRLNAQPNGFPVTFAFADTQYVALVVGGGGPMDSVMRAFTPELVDAAPSTTLWVFKLSDE